VSVLLRILGVDDKTDLRCSARFTAKGDVKAQLRCEETKFENGNWTMGNVASQRDIKCEITDLVVPVKELTGIAR
jgi:hypothetical protein